MLVGSKVEGSGGVKRSRVSPGSLCRSLGPAARSCSSSSLSAGCTAARWCLWRRDKMDDRHEVTSYYLIFSGGGGFDSYLP